MDLRASALPMAFRCPGSVRPGEIQLNATHAAASAGTAAHAVLRSLAETGSLNWSAIPAAALRYGVPVDEVRLLCALGNKLWPGVASSFPQALTEVELQVEVIPGVMLSGHVDLLSISDTVARCGDWKTGRKDSDYAEQMRAYAALVLLENPELTEATVTALWVRDGSIENYTMTRPEAFTWLQRLLDEVVHWNGVYRPGDHCPHCPRSHECPAHNALIRRDVAAIADRQLVARAECEIELMSPEEIVSVHAKAALVVKYAERVLAAVKSHVQKRGDVVADGVRLTIETEPRRAVDPLAAWPVLEAAGFGDEDFAACMNLHISRVEKRMAQKAGRGFGANAVRALNEKLEAAGAIEKTTIEKLSTKRA